MSGEVIPFPSRARPREDIHLVLPAGVDFYAVVEALGPSEDNMPSGFAVIYLERCGDGRSPKRTEAATFAKGDFDEAIAFADEANATWGPSPRGAA